MTAEPRTLSLSKGCPSTSLGMLDFAIACGKQNRQQPFIWDDCYQSPQAALPALSRILRKCWARPCIAVRILPLHLLCCHRSSPKPYFYRIIIRRRTRFVRPIPALRRFCISTFEMHKRFLPHAAAKVGLGFLGLSPSVVSVRTSRLSADGCYPLPCCTLRCLCPDFPPPSPGMALQMLLCTADRGNLTA